MDGIAYSPLGFRIERLWHISGPKSLILKVCMAHTCQLHLCRVSYFLHYNSTLKTKVNSLGGTPQS